MCLSRMVTLRLPQQVSINSKKRELAYMRCLRLLIVTHASKIRVQDRAEFNYETCLVFWGFFLDDHMTNM